VDVPGEPGPKRRLEQLDLWARKGLGQHFLTNRSVLSKIVAAAEIESSDTVVEVGPGLGVLTSELLEHAARVIAVEIDRSLALALHGQFSNESNLAIINEDVLKLEPGQILAQAGTAGTYKVVANLPYYIASAVLRHFLESANRPELMVVMVQYEVARSIAAKPGEMSLLSLGVQIFGHPKVMLRVPPGSFYPPPKVWSAVVRIDAYPEPLIPEKKIPGFFRLARAAFCAARKQVQNSLAQGLGFDKAVIVSRLEAAGIIPRRRAETLSIPEWVKLWQQFEELLCPV
jgi:16S rRNA (adenine1518-N6/adenine1519-N6)-dimethyltransferase